jgi:hypothetical protein
VGIANVAFDSVVRRLLQHGRHEPASDKLNYRGKGVVRLLSTVLITICCLMVLLGSTVWSNQLGGPLYLLYWSWCFLTAILAGLLAVLDMILIRRASQQTRQELLRRQFTGKG